MQAIPLPHDEVSFQRDGEEIARFHFAQDQRRPFVFPVIGPSGRSLTRMGHPHDPNTHSHHNSVWFSHQFVGGADFWSDNGGRISHHRVLRYEDADDVAFAETENAWLDKEGKPVLHDRRRISVKPLADAEWLLLLDLQLEARTADVPLGETPFGMLGVRMAKTIGVLDGGGTIRNSEGGVDEAACFRKPARWMDYIGPIAKDEVRGMKDEAGEPKLQGATSSFILHPWSSRASRFSIIRKIQTTPSHSTATAMAGWARRLHSLARSRLKNSEPLRLRYALYVHAGMPSPEKFEEQWKAFTATPWMDFPEKKK